MSELTIKLNNDKVIPTFWARGMYQLSVENRNYGLWDNAIRDLFVYWRDATQKQIVVVVEGKNGQFAYFEDGKWAEFDAASLGNALISAQETKIETKPIKLKAKSSKTKNAELRSSEIDEMKKDFKTK